MFSPARANQLNDYPSMIIVKVGSKVNSYLVGGNRDRLLGLDPKEEIGWWLASLRVDGRQWIHGGRPVFSCSHPDTKEYASPAWAQHGTGY